MVKTIQPIDNPYRELRKELILVYQQLGKTLNKIDLILKRLEGEME